MQPPERPARPLSEDADPRFALLVAEVAARLRPVCHDWDEPRFQTLVHRIARTKVQWDDALGTGARGAGPSRTDARRPD